MLCGTLANFAVESLTAKIAKDFAKYAKQPLAEFASGR